MNMPRFNIGDKVWQAGWDSIDSWVTCPDCGGTGRIRCILWDETELSIDCEGCSCGYNPPTGHIHVYERRATAKLVTITGFEVRADGTDYRTLNNYIVKDDHLFDNQDAAAARAVELAAEVDREERERIGKKEKPTKNWAWHVHYHRKCIRRAQEEIEHHTAKLNVARIKAKEPANADE